MHSNFKLQLSRFEKQIDVDNTISYVLLVNDWEKQANHKVLVDLDAKSNITSNIFQMSRRVISESGSEYTDS